MSTQTTAYSLLAMGKLITKNGGKKFSLTFADLYEGFWKDDMKNGKGRMITHKGEVYQGDWRHDVKDGYGKKYNKEGVFIQGRWKDGEAHGK